MGKILKLPESLIRLIAAGEVVERPASVAKELIENSLDAQATEIAIDLWGAGRTRLRVTDNGEGMTPEDAEQALDRHATSKLRSLDDLHALHSFGFRGEALPSIAAVSRFELSTRTAEAKEGWRIQIEGGKEISKGPHGMPKGTVMDVQDLFFNTPARSKFLKKDGTERSHLLKTLQELALAHPSVRFQASMDGKNVLDVPPAKKLGGRIADLWGISVTENLVPLDVTAGPCRIRGFVNKISHPHATKSLQSLFVNQRAVQQRVITHAVYEGFHEWLPVGRHPIYVLFVDLDPTLVDVNVHPTKREVRFADERALHDLIYRSIRNLFKEQARPNVSPTDGPSFASSYASRGTEPESSVALLTQAPLAVAQDFLLADAPLTAAPHIPLLAPDRIQFLGQFQRLYLLTQQDEALILFDQHAAAERVHYERLLEEAKQPSPARQACVTPFVWETTPDHADVVRTYLGELDALGFGLEAFGSNSFALKEWPARLPQTKQAKRFLEEVIETLKRESPSDQNRVRHEIAARAACRAAIMAGDPVSKEEALQLIKDLSRCERPMTCPHGRPTHIRLSKPELDRRFQRA